MLSFASATGNLFNRIGKLGLLIKQMRSYQNSQLTNLIDTTNGVVAQYNGESDIQALIGSSYMNQLNNAGSIGSLAAQVAETTINRMVFRDQPQLAQNLISIQTVASLAEIIRQMKLAGATVLAMPVTATPAAFSGIGNGIIVASVRRPQDGLVLENSFSETLLFTCTSDSYSGTALAGNEGFAVTGTGSESNFFAFDWPLGSDGQISSTAINGNADNSQGNILTNSDFEDFTGNTPDQWMIAVGNGGTQVFEENSIVYDPAPSKAVRILGDGSTLTTLEQDFDSATGTQGELQPFTQYAVNIFLRRDGAAAAAGQLAVELTDTLGAVILDANNVANQFTIDLTNLTTVYAAYNGVFRTPFTLPSGGYKIRLRQTTGNALTAGRSVYLDKLALGSMNQMYLSGPYVSFFGGSIPFAVGDRGTCLISNSRGTAGTLDTFQTLFARMLPVMYSNEFLLPSSATPSLDDAALIS